MHIDMMGKLSTFTGLFMIVMCFTAAESVYMHRTYDDTLKVKNGGPWGFWYYPEFCQDGQYAVGFQLKVQAYQGSGDDTALNAVQLNCSDGTTISSRQQKWGTWKDMVNCDSGTYITGFKLKVEGKQGSGDDTAANYMRARCRDFRSSSSVTEINIGSDSDGWGTYGSWSNNCQDNQVVCGLRTRIELETKDNTALNDVELFCCKKVTR